MRSAFVFSLFLFGSAITPIFAEDNIPATADQLWNVKLEECIDLALKNNLGLNIAWLDQDVAENNITIADSNFDPNFSGSARENKSQSATAASVLDGSSKPKSESQNFRVGADKLFEYGTNVDVYTSLNRSTNNSSYNLLDPEYSSSIGINVRQPLWRGFGKTVNLAPLMRAQNSHKQTKWNTELTVFELLADVERNYWLLAYAQADLEVKRTSLKVSETTLREAKIKMEADIGSLVDIYAAEADVSSKQEDIIISENSLRNYQDELLRLMGVIMQKSTVSPQANTDVPDSLKRETPPFDIVFKRANDLDPALKAQQLAILNLEIDQQVAENQNKTRVDLVASGSYSGRNDTYYDSYDGTIHGDGYNWSVGVEISFPWKFRNATASELNSRIRLRQAKMRLDSIEEQLLVSLRNAWRSIEANKKRIVTASANLQYSKQALDQEQGRFRLGASTIRDVLEAQRNWEDASNRFLRARLDTVIAEIALARLDGSILERHGFTWEELPPPESAENKY